MRIYLGDPIDARHINSDPDKLLQDEAARRKKGIRPGRCFDFFWLKRLNSQWDAFSWLVRVRQFQMDSDRSGRRGEG